MTAGKGQKSSTASHRLSFNSARDARNRKVRGLWKRGERCYAQVRVPGEKSARKIPLKALTLTEAKEEMATQRTHARVGALPKSGVEPGFDLDTSVSAAGGGAIAGGGTYAGGANVILTATPEAGYRFVNWTDHGAEVSIAPTYAFLASAGRARVANFALIIPQLTMSASPAGSLRNEWPDARPGWVLEENPDMSPGSWVHPQARLLSPTATNRP